MRRFMSVTPARRPVLLGLRRCGMGLSAGLALALAVLAGPASAADCPGNPNALGTSRIVEIDTAGGPLFGAQQYAEKHGGIDFLKDHEVVLTFDDGPLPAYTRPVLDALARHCTKATFFAVGRMAIAYPDTLKAIHAAGHTIANHTWTHRNLKSISPDKAKAEIELGFATVARSLELPIAPFFRFPYLSDPSTMIGYLKGRNVAMFSIDVDSIDFRTRSPGDVLRRVMSRLAYTRKGIILFHDIQPSTAGAMPMLLAELKSKGFKVVHVTAKAPVKTIAAFEGEADSLYRQKRRESGGNTVVSRALTYPMQQDAEKEPGPRRRPTRDRRSEDGSGDRVYDAGAGPVSAPVRRAAPAVGGWRQTGQ